MALRRCDAIPRHEPVAAGFHSSESFSGSTYLYPPAEFDHSGAHSRATQPFAPSPSPATHSYAGGDSGRSYTTASNASSSSTYSLRPISPSASFGLAGATTDGDRTHANGAAAGPMPGGITRMHADPLPWEVEDAAGSSIARTDSTGYGTDAEVAVSHRPRWFFKHLRPAASSKVEYSVTRTPHAHRDYRGPGEDEDIEELEEDVEESACRSAL